MNVAKNYWCSNANYTQYFDFSVCFQERKTDNYICPDYLFQ